uniref:Uncharacterized protein n=1 Tax=Caenorhabditis tropicalis TaxID=1561998 RepID=A0A1I7TKL7_9PELO
MPPNTRASLKKAAKSQESERAGHQKQPDTSELKKSTPKDIVLNTEEPEIICIAEKPPNKQNEKNRVADSDIETISSSSAEDSDDDWDKKRVWNKSDTEGSSDDEPDDHIVTEMERKTERDTKKKRLRKKEKQFLEGEVADDGDVECVFESTDVAKIRKRRLYRRKMLRATSTVKRRRIKRPEIDMADDYTCDSLVGVGPHIKSLTNEFDWNDPDIDANAARRLFRDLGSDDDFSDISEEDEADIVSNNFAQYQSRNCRERVTQVIELDLAPFSEKLTCYNSLKSIHGASRSSIQNYHPGFLNIQDIKLPEELLWEQPFKTVLYLPTQFDAHEKCNKFLNKVSNEKKNETETKLLKELKQKIEERTAEKIASNHFYDYEQFDDNDELLPEDDNLNDIYSSRDNFEDELSKLGDFSNDDF